MRSMFRAFLALALALSGGGAFAQVSAADGAFDRFYAQVTGVGKQTVSFGSGGQVVVGQGVPQISTSGGPVNVDRSIPLRNNSGGLITANARVSIPSGTLAKILRAGARYSTLLAVGAALYDVFTSELGLAVQDGKVLTVPPEPGGYSDPYEYSVAASGSTWYPDWLTPCNAKLPLYATGVVAGWSNYGYDYNCQYTMGPPYAPGSTQVVQIYRRNQTSAPPPLVGQEVTEQQLADAIAQKSGWPASSRVGQAVADVTAREPAPSFPATPTVTGPATSPGETKTKANPDGSTTTTTTTHNHTYSGPTVNTTTTTVTSTCNGGSCNTTTETETPKLDEQPFSMPCGVAGMPACAVKVDETGVPNATDVNADRLRDLEEQNADWIEGLVAANPFPDINWAFELPTACGVIPTPAFAPAVDGIDVCQFQPMFHELMTVVWMLGGLFGAISLFMRNALTT